MVLGDAVYRNCAAVVVVSSTEALADDLAGLVKQRNVPEPHQTEAYFERVWRASHGGELGLLSADNILLVARAIQHAPHVE